MKTHPIACAPLWAAAINCGCVGVFDSNDLREGCQKTFYAFFAISIMRGGFSAFTVLSLLLFLSGLLKTQSWQAQHLLTYTYIAVHSYEVERSPFPHIYAVHSPI